MGIQHYTIPDIEQKDLKTITLVLRQVKRIIKNEKSQSYMFIIEWQRSTLLC